MFFFKLELISLKTILKKELFQSADLIQYNIFCIFFFLTFFTCIWICVFKKLSLNNRQWRKNVINERERRWWRRQKISNTQQVHHWGSTVRNEEICGECLDIWNIHLKVYGSIPRVSNIYDFKLESKVLRQDNK